MNRGVPCKFILNKESCPYGKKCRFLHQYRADYKELVGGGHRQQSSSREHSVEQSDRQGQQSLKGERDVSTDHVSASKVQDSEVQGEKVRTSGSGKPNTLGNLEAGDSKVRDEYVKTSDVSHQKEGKLTQRVCHFYLQNSQCKFGDKCRYGHSSQDGEGRKDVFNERGNYEVKKGLPLKQDKGHERSTTNSRNPPSLTLASFIGGRTYVKRPHRANRGQKGSSSKTLREVS